MKKLYSVSRILLFQILIDFDLQLLEAGELFISAFISDDDAKLILTEWPNSISLLKS